MRAREMRLMAAPSIEAPWCALCGRPAASRHHVVHRSQGGASGPTVTVCGRGNEGGCHGLLHAGLLHLDFRDGAWHWLRTDAPTSADAARDMDGWRPLRDAAAATIGGTLWA